MNGHIVFASGTEEGSLITFQCNPGFTLHSGIVTHLTAGQDSGVSGLRT